MAQSTEYCRALYDYDATGKAILGQNVFAKLEKRFCPEEKRFCSPGRDEISFHEDDLIRIMKKCPNGVDDGWWLGEINNKMGLFPSIVVEEVESDSAGKNVLLNQKPFRRQNVLLMKNVLQERRMIPISCRCP